MQAHEASVLHILAHALLENDQPAKAAVLLEALDALRPSEPRTLLALATAQLRSGSPPAALQTLARLAPHADAWPAAHLVKAQALSTLGQADEAMASMQQFLATRTRTTSQDQKNERTL